MTRFATLLSAAVLLFSSVPPVYSATHLEVLNAVKQKWNSLPGTDPSADNQELLAFVRTIPEFSDSGLDPRCSCVWAVFSDGPLVVLANNSKLQGPPPPASAPEPRSAGMSSALHSQSLTPLAGPAAPAPAEMPKAQFVTLMNARGSDMPNPIPTLRIWLAAQSYFERPLACTDASVACLRNGPNGEGIYYLNTYGGSVDRGGGQNDFVLATSTVVTAATAADPAIKADVEAKRLAYGPHDHYWNPVTRKWEKETVYWINAAFIREHWRNREFAENSLVFIDACDSHLSEDFKQAIFNRKASVYAGWSAPVDTNQGPEVAKFFFDRLLGANKVEPEADGFKQRSFDYVQAGRDADLHGMNDFPAFVRFTPNPAQTQTSFGQLSPSIALEAPLEVSSPFSPYRAGTLQINGTFGSDPRPDPDSSVTVGGVDCPIQTPGWTPDEILCDLPPGAAGDVVVTVRKHESNKARLTKWNGTFRYRVNGDDTLNATITYRVSFRADIRKVRRVIHDPPFGPFLLTATVIPDESSASYMCSGTAVKTDASGTTTITWSGSGTVTASRTVPPPANSFQMGLSGLFGPVAINLDHGSGLGCDWTSVFVPTGGGPITTTGRWRLDVGEFDIGAMPVEPADPSFLAGFKTWTGFDCSSPLTLTPPTCRMEWDRIPAALPPDPNSPR